MNVDFGFLKERAQGGGWPHINNQQSSIGIHQSAIDLDA